MIKKFYLIIIVLTLILSIGCSQNEPTLKTPSEIPTQEKSEYPNTEASNSGAKEATPNIIEEAVSPDGKYTAYLVSLDGINRIFLGQEKDFQKAKEINNDTDYIKKINWSPNSEFFFAGNSDFGDGAIFSVKDMSSSSFSFESGPFWSPDGSKLCFTEDSAVWSSSKNHSVVTFDVMVKNLMASEHLGPTVFARGSEDYYYKVNNWDKNGEIKYERRSREDDQLLANLSSQYTHYLWSFNSNSGERKDLETIFEFGYRYFNISPDKKWLSMVKLTFSGGEAEGGIPTFYNLETGELRELGKEFPTWFWNPEWFEDSSKIVLNETSIYDVATGKLTEYQLPSEKIWLGAKPSPDGSKLVVLGCNRVHRTGSEGEPLTVYLLDLEGKILKTIQTPLLPNYSSNLLMPTPVKFDWLTDNQKLIIEAWSQKSYETTLQKLNLAGGELSQLAINTYSPKVAPDGKSIAVFSTDMPEKSVVYNKLQVLDTEGKILTTLDIEREYSVIWDDNSMNILVWGYSEDRKNKVLTKINIGSRKSTSFKVEDTISPLYIENEDIVCVGGPIK